MCLLTHPTLGETLVMVTSWCNWFTEHLSGGFLSFISCFLCVSRYKSQSGKLSLPEMCYAVPDLPVAPVRTPSLLLCSHGERAGEVARCVSGLHPTYQQRWVRYSCGNKTVETLSLMYDVFFICPNLSNVFGEPHVPRSLDCLSRFIMTLYAYSD